MGAAVNQIAVSKVMLCFTLASHKSHRAWHLSGCRSETQHPTPVTQTPTVPQQMEGLTRQSTVEKWGHTILLDLLLFFNKVKQNKWKIKKSGPHATGFRVQSDIYVLLYTRVSQNWLWKKCWLSIGVLLFYWVWQHCQNTTGAASSNNLEVGNKLSNELLLYRDPIEEQ